MPSTNPLRPPVPVPFHDQLQFDTLAERAHLHAAPVIAAALGGRVDRRHYVAFLTRAYHHVKHTVPLMMACGARLDDDREWLREAFAHYIDEEIGHQRWILSDIAAAGGDADAVRDSLPDPDTDLLIAYAYDTAMRRNPAGILGMVFVLEGTSVGFASAAAAALQRHLALPPTAFTYLTSHGALDTGHLAFFETLIDRLDATDRAAVVRSAKMVYRLYGDVLRGIDVTDAR